MTAVPVLPEFDKARISEDLARVLLHWRTAWAAQGTVSVPVVDGNELTSVGQLNRAQHATQLSRGVIQLYKHGLTIQAAPLVRLTTEIAITSIWARFADHAGDRLFADYASSERTLVQDIAKMGGDIDDYREGNEELIRDITAKHGDLGKFKAPSVLAQSETFVGGEQAYAFYRLVSRYCHAGHALGQSYAREVKDDIWPYALADSADYSLADLAFGMQLVGTCHALASWALLPNQTPAAQDLLLLLREVAERTGFDVDLAPAPQKQEPKSRPRTRPTAPDA